jgi:RES domain-containing protein
MFFLDESGFGLSLPPTYAWARKGEAKRVPRAWGRSGRVKGFLMPRRHYGSVEELRRAVAVAMERLREEMGQEVLQSLCVGTYKGG